MVFIIVKSIISISHTFYIMMDGENNSCLPWNFYNIS